MDRQPAGPDPILAGPADGPCAAAAEGADYASGVDATGNAVVPAEGPAAAGDAPRGTVMVTLPRHGPHAPQVSAPVDLAKLTAPACEPSAAPAPARR
ncbi:MAG TPA: hypothetical protein VNU97_17905 [Rhizomicrobium sp.]|nr:hypothetical protein [Rhizomicrobium sp.]